MTEIYILADRILKYSVVPVIYDFSHEMFMAFIWTRIKMFIFGVTALFNILLKYSVVP
jgi:hypothetical protein